MAPGKSSLSLEGRKELMPHNGPNNFKGDFSDPRNHLSAKVHQSNFSGRVPVRYVQKQQFLQGQGAAKKVHLAWFMKPKLQGCVISKGFLAYIYSLLKACTNLNYSSCLKINIKKQLLISKKVPA